MQKIEKLMSLAAKFYDNGDPGHDFAHIRRVTATCRKIAEAEGAELEPLLAAAILHDIVNLPKNHPERLQASARAAAESREVLLAAGFSAAEIERVGQVITEHSYSLGKKPSSIESAILQDADKLDALGAIGVMRTVSCGCRMGSAYYNVDEPFANERAHDDKAYTIDHFFTKLLKLPALMNTEMGKREAETRAAYMRGFLEQLKTEISL